MRNTLVCTLLALLLTTTAVAQETVRENDKGRLWWNSGNELLMDSTRLFADAAKVRVGAFVVPGESGGGGAYSFDLLGFRGRSRTEVALWTGSFNGVQGEIGLSIWNGREPFGDANQVKVAEFFADHVEFKVPISAPNLTGGSRPLDYLESASGRFRTYMQGEDGNLVTYEIVGTWLCPRWSSMHGRIDPRTSAEPTCR